MEQKTYKIGDIEAKYSRIGSTYIAYFDHTNIESITGREYLNFSANYFSRNFKTVKALKAFSDNLSCMNPELY